MANGSRHSLFSVQENNYGITPNNPALNLVRITGTTLGLSKDSLQSGEVRSDRQISDFRLGANQVSGDISFEMSYGSFDTLLRAALLSSDWQSPADTGTISLSATSTGYARASGSFIDDGFVVGQTVTSSGFTAGYNGKSVITSVDATTLDTAIIGAGEHAAQTTGAGKQLIASPQISAASERGSFTFVRHFSDIQAADNPFYVYRGVEINSLQLTISANSIATGTFSVTGQSQETAQSLAAMGTPTFPTASATSTLDSFTGTLQEGGTTIAVVTEISLTLANGIEPRFVIGSRDSINPSVGRSNLTGQISAFFEDSTLVNKFLNETESSLIFSMPDADGNMQRYKIPRIKYTGGQPDVSGEGPITLTMPFQALLDPDQATNFIIERTAA